MDTLESKENKETKSKPNRRLPKPVNRKLQMTIEYALVILGSFIVAISFNLFLLANQIASGGVSGISILVEQLTGIQPAFTQWGFNIPLFVIGTMLLGRRFGFKVLLSSIVLPLFVYLTRDWPAPTDNPLLASIYGGMGIGLGLGIVYRGRGSTGGLDLVAQIIHRFTGLSYPLSVAMLDGIVILCAGVLLSPEKALYALIGLFVTSKMIDAVQVGFGFSKVAFIISAQTEPLTEAILHELDRGLTKWDGQGGFTKEGRTVLMVVVGQTEVSKLKAIVKRVDPTAFVIISNTNEVLGEGFKLHGS
ncbi:YitT family protein [Paenibacillus sp. MSJ-34]|uniref:YitT family protein n=1 Tax=Paenibacillus sp. MSJ-34 TaxID=2841529 RepID=UPI001C10913E|nr:YitT family protein [Paenibacillus sp. MSJ-34]MBU5441019.1 YitT family protein [Paenibacillus sp. MSJ-34]